MLTESGSDSPVSLWVIDSQDLWISTGKTEKSKLSENYYSAYNNLGGDFGVALWRDTTDTAVLLRFTPSPTPNPQLYATWNSNSGAGEYIRYTVFTQMEITSGAFNPKMNWAILALNLMVAVILIYYLKTAVISLVWLILYPILVGLVQAKNTLDHGGLFVAVCLVVDGVAFSLGYFTSKLRRVHQLIIVVACTIVAGIVMALGDPSGYDSGSLYMAPVIILVGSALACKCCLVNFVKYADGTVNKLEAVSLLSFSAVFATNIFYFRIGFPAIPWLTLQQDWRPYIKDRADYAYMSFIHLFVYLFLTAVLFGVVSRYYNAKPANFFTTHEGNGGLDSSVDGQIDEVGGPLSS